MNFALSAIVIGSATVSAMGSDCKIISAMGGTAELQLFDYTMGDDCCNGLSTAIVYGVARSDALPMPWTNLGAMLGITACPDYVAQFGECTDEDAYVNTANDAAAGNAMRHVCDNHADCNVENLKGTGVAAAMEGVLKAAITKESVCEIAGKLGPAPTTAAPTTAAPTTAAPTTAAPTTAAPATEAPAKAPAPATEAPDAHEGHDHSTAAPTPAPSTTTLNATGGNNEASEAQCVTAKLWLALAPAAFALGSLAA